MAMEQVGDDKAFLLELIGDMLNERDQHIQELNAAFETNDASVRVNISCKSNPEY